MTLQPGAYDPRFKPATLCRCGHILECCADCNAWLVDNSPRIAGAWRYYTNHIAMGSARVAQVVQDFADLTERFTIEMYESRR